MSETVTVTFSVAEGARRLGCTEDLYQRRLRARVWPGHKIGRTWRLTESDLAAALELSHRPAQAPSVDAAGLTRTSRRRITRTKK